MDRLEASVRDGVIAVCDERRGAHHQWRRALSTALVLQTAESFSTPTHVTHFGAPRAMEWASMCFEAMSSKKDAAREGGSHDACLLLFTVIMGRALPAPNGGEQHQGIFSGSDREFHQQCVRWLSDYFFEISNTAPSDDTSFSSSFALPHDKQQEDLFFESSVAGYKLVACLSALWALHRQSGVGFTPTTTAQRRCEKVFGERLLSKYVRMLVAFLKQEPILPLRSEERGSVDGIVNLRLDVHQLFGVTSALASSLLGELLSAGHGREHAHAIEEELAAKRALGEGPVALRRGLRILDEWTRPRPSGRASVVIVDPTQSSDCHSLAEASAVACGLLLVYVPIVVDIVSVVVPQEGIASFNELLHVIEDLRLRLADHSDRISERSVEVLHWTSALLVHTQGDAQKADVEVEAWLRAARREGRTSMAIGRPSGIDDTQATQDRQRSVSPRKAVYQSDYAVAPSSSIAAGAAELSNMALTLARLADQCSGAAEVASSTHLELERARSKCNQQALTISTQEFEISSLRDALAQVRQQLLEESSSHASQVSQLTSTVRQLQEASAAQTAKSKTLERQIKRFEQMSAVIRSMTTEVAGVHDEGM